jgi:ABC-type lipoprotein export system ATPase subunit
MINLKKVTKQYGTTKAVDDVSIDINRGDFAMIVGRSGSGKTTLLSLIAGLTRPTSGSVLIEGTDIWTLSDKDLSLLRNRKFGFIFQLSYMIPTLNVIENIMSPTAFGKVDFDPCKRCLDLINMLKLSHRAKALPSELSGGELKKVCIARALMNKPEIILADEPTGDLDVESEAEVMEILRKINAEGVTIVMVTHNLDLTRYANTLYKMANGKITKM